MKKTILITGCSTGIGKASALMLQQQGHNVYATARKPEDVKKLQAEGLKSLLLDLDKHDTIDQCVEQITQEEAQIDVLFHNAAYAQGGAIEDIPTDAFIAQFQTNVFGWHHLNRQIIPIMRKQGHGTIIFNSSVLGLVTLPFRGPYCATKYAIESIADAMRVELSVDNANIHIVLIEPGPVKTAFRKNANEVLKKTIDFKKSHFASLYISRLNEKPTGSEGAKSQFAVSAQDVAKKVVYIIGLKKPKPRYYISQFTYILGLLKRLTSSALFEKIILKMTKREIKEFIKKKH